MKIAIIGAGLSGLTLAHRLKDFAELTLFEKSRGFGGRMAARRYKKFQFDHGVQFFQAKDKSFQSFLKPMIEKKIVQTWKGFFVEFEGNKKISQRVWRDEPAHYVGAPGMNAIGKYLAQSLPESVKIKLNTKVKTISKENLSSLDSHSQREDKFQNHQKIDSKNQMSKTKWNLLDEKDQTLGFFDWVIATAPPEQTFVIMPKSFKYYSLLSSIRMKACFSLMLGFKNALPLEFQSALVKGCDISWISVNNSKPKRENSFCLLVHSTNDWADIHLETDPEKAIQHLSQETSFVLGYDVSKADHQSLHRWRYANIELQKTQNWIDENQKLAACGDWTRQGRVEAAFLSAEQTAQSLYKILK